jgi:hypothetical protein
MKEAPKTFLEPVYVSIDDAAKFTGESPWTVKMELRAGILRARKAGRRTLVEVASLKERAAKMPPAAFAPPPAPARKSA